MLSGHHRLVLHRFRHDDVGSDNCIPTDLNRSKHLCSGADRRPITDLWHAVRMIRRCGELSSKGDAVEDEYTAMNLSLPPDDDILWVPESDPSIDLRLVADVDGEEKLTYPTEAVRQKRQATDVTAASQPVKEKSLYTARRKNGSHDEGQGGGMLHVSLGIIAHFLEQASFQFPSTD